MSHHEFLIAIGHFAEKDTESVMFKKFDTAVEDEAALQAASNHFVRHNRTAGAHGRVSSVTLLRRDRQGSARQVGEREIPQAPTKIVAYANGKEHTTLFLGREERASGVQERAVKWLRKLNKDIEEMRAELVPVDFYKIYQGDELVGEGRAEKPPMPPMPPIPLTVTTFFYSVEGGLTVERVHRRYYLPADRRADDPRTFAEIEQRNRTTEPFIHRAVVGFKGEIIKHLNFHLTNRGKHETLFKDI